MRYLVDYSFLVSHLFEVTVLGFLLLVGMDVYARYYKITRSTEEFDNTLVDRYVILQRIRSKK